jgi:hypothetical protein
MTTDRDAASFEIKLFTCSRPLRAARRLAHPELLRDDGVSVEICTGERAFWAETSRALNCNGWAATCA